MEEVIAIVALLFLGGSFLVSPLIAMKKGFAPYYWLFACGPLGLVVIVSLPNLKSTKTPEEYEQLENYANFMGAILSSIGIFMLISPAVSALTSVRVLPLPAPYMSPAVQPTKIIETIPAERI